MGRGRAVETRSYHEAITKLQRSYHEGVTALRRTEPADGFATKFGQHLTPGPMQEMRTQMQVRLFSTHISDAAQTMRPKVALASGEVQQRYDEFTYLWVYLRGKRLDRPATEAVLMDLEVSLDRGKTYVGVGGSGHDASV